MDCLPSAVPGIDNSPPPYRNWAASLLRMLMLRAVNPVPPAVGVWTLTILAGLAFAVWIGIDWFDNQPDPTFLYYDLPLVSWYALILLAVAAVTARRCMPATDFSRVLAVVLAATPLVTAVLYLCDAVLLWPWNFVVVSIAVAYFSAYASRSLRVLTGQRQPAAVMAGIVVTIGLLWLTDELYVDASVWTTEDTTEMNDTPAEAEALLFSQSQRIDRAMQRVQAAPRITPGETPVVFFVGFAGFGEQRVFAEEIELASRIIGERFGSLRRTVLLLNDRRSLDAEPLASPTALRYALHGIAAKMDLERDILFLALSSHGSQGVLSVSNGLLMLHDLTAEDLASALHESGIRWRIVVVSACYSGSFIEALRDPQTIVITASAADKTSFGCADDRDLTYFGEAFYRDAMPRAISLREAFAQAKAAIAEREKYEKVTPSDPQAFFGEAIEKKLLMASAR